MVVRAPRAVGASRGRPGGEHAARSVDHGRDAGLVQRVADGDGVGVALHEHADVTGADRHRLGPRCLCGRCRDLSAEASRRTTSLARSVTTHARAPAACEETLVCELHQVVVAMQHPDPQRHVYRSAGHPSHRRARRPRGWGGRRSPDGRAWRRRTARRSRRAAPGRCASSSAGWDGAGDPVASR